MDGVKICITCGVLKKLEEFYAHKEMADGRLNKCKKCQQTNSQRNYRKNRKSRIAYEKAREGGLERKAKKAAYQRRLRENNPEKYKARTAVGNALRDRRLFKGNCKCGSDRVQAHHKDYSKPLEVEWMCRSCHVILHGKVPF